MPTTSSLRPSRPMKLLPLLLAVAAIPAWATGPEMIVNGSFESPAYGATGVHPGGGDGWTQSFLGHVSIINGNIKDGGGHRYGRTEFGEQYLGLDPRFQFNPYSADSQTIPGFVAGHQYKLSLGVADSDGGLAPQLEVELSDDMGHDYFDKVFDVPVGGPYGTKIRFTRLHALFRSPVTGPITLSLRNVGTGADPGSISIDRVSLVEVSDEEAQAPEPSRSSSFQPLD
jgi:hypothetical protein